MANASQRSNVIREQRDMAVRIVVDQIPTTFTGVPSQSTVRTIRKSPVRRGLQRAACWKSLLRLRRDGDTRPIQDVMMNFAVLKKPHSLLPLKRVIHIYREVPKVLAGVPPGVSECNRSMK